MKITHIFLLLIVVSAGLASCMDNSPLFLAGKKSEQSSHLGRGVWVVVPSGFRRAKTYDGFQAEFPTTSISLQIEDVPLSAVKESLSPKVLRSKKTKLLEFRPVEFGTIDSAFFAVVQDNKKGTIRYLLSIQQGSRTYNIKAFCLKTQQKQYDEVLRAALYSTHIGEYEEEEKTFQMAGFTSGNSVVYTKDGQLSTSSPDQATIEITDMGRSLNLPTLQSQYDFLKEKVTELTHERADLFGHEPLAKGSFVMVSGKGENIYVLTVLVIDPEERATLVKCTGNRPENLTEFDEFARSNFIKTEIRQR